jgi:hypothetical protein
VGAPHVRISLRVLDMVYLLEPHTLFFFGLAVSVEHPTRFKTLIST